MSAKWLCLAVVLLLPVPAFAEADMLTVTGIGSVPVKPDMARITANVEGHAPVAAEALAAQHAALARVTASLTKAGVTAGDIFVASLALTPQTPAGPILPGQTRTVTGYTVNSQITVTVSNPDKVNDILQALVDAGISQASRVTFSLHDQAGALDQARATAVKDAMAKARVLAQQTGVTLGPVRMVTDGTSPAAQTILQNVLTNLNGTQAVTASVTVGFAIK